MGSITNYSAKDGPFFDRNAGVPKDPVNPGPGGEQFYGPDASLSAPDVHAEEVVQSFSVVDGVTQGGNAGPVGKSGGISAEGDQVNYRATDPFTSYNPSKTSDPRKGIESIVGGKVQK